MAVSIQKRTTATQRTATLVGAVCGLVSVLLVRFAAGSPLTALHRLDAAHVLPPLWLVSLCYLGWFVLLGGAVGYLLSGIGGAFCHGPAEEATLWRGCTCLSLAIMLTFMWYALLFGKFCFIFSLLFLPLACGMAILCAAAWRSIAKGASLLAVGYALWLLLLFFWQVAVILHN